MSNKLHSPVSSIRRQVVPNPKIKGGSKPGKLQRYWPWVLKIVADAVAMRHGREPTFAELQLAMDKLTPGWEEFMDAVWGIPETSNVELLHNRVYKGGDYAGTSARGTDHNPVTRGNVSKEHWSYYFGPTEPLAELHGQIWRGEIVKIQNWKALLIYGPYKRNIINAT